MRFADSFLPVGTYTASYGIEQYLADGRVETAAELGELIAAYLRRTVGPAGTVALAHAHRRAAADDLDGIRAADERLFAATMPAEFRTSSTRAGNTLLELLAETDPELLDGPAAAAYGRSVVDGGTPSTYPVVLGVATASAGIDRRAACLVGGYSFVTGVLGAAQRLGRFGHTEIQTQLAELLPVIGSVADAHVDADLDSLGSFAPLAEIEGMAHERADRRLFMS
jgi:urease accessory protein